MLSHQSLKVMADSVNPALGILTIGLPFAKWRGDWRQPSMHLLVSLLIVAMTYLIRAVFHLEALWANWGLDFSTHTAICVVLVVELSSLYLSRTWIWCAVLLSYADLMVYQGYHSWTDINTTAAVMFPFAAILRFCGTRLSAISMRARAIESP